MKSQVMNQDTGSSRICCVKNSNACRALVMAILVLFVAVNYANAQIGKTSCDVGLYGIGGNYCPSPQYRSGATGIFKRCY